MFRGKIVEPHPEFIRRCKKLRSNSKLWLEFFFFFKLSFAKLERWSSAAAAATAAAIDLSFYASDRFN